MIASRPTVAVCVINWNGFDVLPGCLEAILAQVPAVAEVILVDDASTDGSVQRVQELYPAVCIVRQPENRGTAAARNAGYAASRGDVTVFVDNDVTPEPGCLARLVEALGHAAATLAMPRVVYARAPAIVQYEGAGAHHSGLMTLINADRPAAGLPCVPREIGSIVTACFAVDRRRWGPGPLFDEAFGMYFEDHDLGIRARQRGHRIVAVPAAVCRHGEGTVGISLRRTGRFTKVRVRNTIRNRWQVILKRYQKRTIALLLPSLALFELVQLVGVVRKGWLSYWVEAAAWIVANRRQILAERRAIAAQRRVGDGLVLENGPLPLNPRTASGPIERIVRRGLDLVGAVNWRLARPLLGRRRSEHAPDARPLADWATLRNLLGRRHPGPG